MHCADVEEEEAVEATKAPTETKVLWGPVTKQVTDAIGAPAAVASVLLRTSSATAEVAARMTWGQAISEPFTGDCVSKLHQLHFGTCGKSVVTLRILKPAVTQI